MKDVQLVFEVESVNNFFEYLDNNITDSFKEITESFEKYKTYVKNHFEFVVDSYLRKLNIYEVHHIDYFDNGRTADVLFTNNKFERVTFLYTKFIFKEKK